MAAADEAPAAADEDNNNASSSRRITLPSWLSNYHARHFKIIFRCWVAIWVSTLLIYINPSLQAIGVATFFGPLVLFLIPPAGILFVYLLSAFTLLFGMCLAWAWGIITMKAAYATRSDSQTQVRLEQLNQTAVMQAGSSGRGVAYETEKLIREGFLLDTRVTVVFYVMTCLFVYFMARLRVAKPKFGPGEVFGNIVMDLFLLYGPTLPTFTPLLGKVLVLPGVIGIGLGAVCCVIFFPQSTSHSILDDMSQLVSSLHGSVDCTRARLSGQDTTLPKLQGAKAKISATFKGIQPKLRFLPLDFSRGRWSSDDVRSLHDPLRKLVSSELALLEFHVARMEFEEKAISLASDQEKNGNAADNEYHPHTIGHRQLQKGDEILRAWLEPELYATRSETKEVLRKSTAKVLQVYSESLDIVREYDGIVNSRRWFGHSPEQNLQQGNEILTRLREARQECATETIERLIECHSDLFTPDGQLKPAESLGVNAFRSLFLGMALEERVLACAAAAEDLLAKVLQLSEKRKQNRIWFPSLPGRIVSGVSGIVTSRLDNSMMGATESDEGPGIHKVTSNALRRDGFASRRRKPNFGSIISSTVRNTYHWFTNPAGIYAIRMVVVTIATAIPSSLPATAGFYYREKGLWGVITAQICVLVYMADFTFSLIGRVVGTVLGGLLGMIAWYIGSGSGPGNPYGLAAITAVMALIFIWCRLFFPHSLVGGAVMSGITFVLVLGFSFDATHIDSYGLPGYGYEAFYKRVVTVLLGLLAGLIVQIFPRPPSSSRHIRKTISNTIRILSDSYALLLSQWNKSHTSETDALARQIFFDVAQSLGGLQESIRILKLEIRMDSFDPASLKRAQELCDTMNQALASLHDLSTTLPPHLQEHLVRTVGILDDATIDAVMAVLSVIEQSFETEAPLPERLPTPLLSRYHESKDLTAGFSTELIRDEDYRRYCIGVSSYLRFLSGVDDLVIVLKGVLGESHVVDRTAV